MDNDASSLDQRKKRKQKGPKDASVEILDVGSLLALEELKEEDEALILDKREIQRKKDEIKKLQNASLCQRCRDLRFGSIQEQEQIERDRKNHEALVRDSGATLLAPFVNSFDREHLLDLLRQKIYKRSIIVYVCDLSNFEASIVPELLEMVEDDAHRLIVVANKLDALPRGIRVETM